MLLDNTYSTGITNDDHHDDHDDDCNIFIVQATGASRLDPSTLG